MNNRQDSKYQEHRINGDEGFYDPDPRTLLYHHPTYGQPVYYGAGYGDDAGGDEDGVDLLKLVHIILRRWFTVFTLLVVGILVALVYLFLATRFYSAEAELEMSVRRPKVINSQAVIEDPSYARDVDALMNTRFAKFHSPAMEQMALTEYQKRYPDEQILQKKFRKIVREEVEWTKDRDSNIVRVEALSPDPLFVTRLVNVLTYCAGEMMIQENQSLSDNAVQWLATQAEEQRTSLDKVERELTELRKKLQLDTLRQRSSALGEALKEVSTAKSAIENQLATSKTTYAFMLELNAEKQDFDKLPSGLPKEDQFRALIADWRSAKSNLDQVSNIYTEQHPEYQRLLKEVQRTHRRIEEFISDMASTVDNQIRLLERQRAQLSERVESMEKQSIVLEEQLVNGQQQLQILERRREAADDAYQAVLRRMEEARLSADENTAFINVIRDATIPEKAVRPKKILVLSFGAFLGIVAGCGVALSVEFLTDKVALVGDLKDLHLNILGIIPSQKNGGTRSDLAMIGFKDKFSHVFEIFAGINTVLSSDKYRDRTKVLLVCSVMPGEGKTFSSCNLAISAALNGARTLLIDGDLRRPRLANVFGISEQHPSLLEWLSAEDQTLDFAHLVSRDIHKNLDVITSRPHEHTNPAELLGRGRMAELIEWARQHYDRVIVDSPPFGLVGDTQAIANEVDSVIIVSRLGVTKKRSLKFALSRFVELDVFVLGCIANDVPHSLSGMFSGGEYGYAYGGYGMYKPYGRSNDKTT